MNIKNYFRNITLLALILFINAGISFSQTTKSGTPRQEKLLNELNLLIWNVPNAEKATVKLRIHKGAAFDRQNKEGTMALLANMLFPNQASREFFEEDLGGSVEIITNYDYIQINATSNSDKVLDVLQTLANAVINPQIDKETTEIVKKAQIEKVKLLEENPAYIADQAAAKRLFNTFPYGRPEMGTVESLQKIDFADLIFARERFLTSDNATISIVGNVKPDLIYKAARRYFGGWIKSDNKIPATFKLPDAPDTSTAVIYSSATENVEVRGATTGIARNDKDFAAMQILLPILTEKWSAAQPEYAKQTAIIKHRANYLPGIFMISSSVPTASADDYLKKVTMLEKPLETVTNADFEKSKTALINEFNSSLTDFDKLSEKWLDIETFKLGSINDQAKALQDVTFADVKRVGEKLFDKNFRVTVILNKKPAETSENKN